MATQRTKLPPEEVAELWKAYKAKPSEAGRNALVENYLPIVKYTAERLYAKLPDEVDLDDLMSVGVFGLLDAIKSFDLTRGVKFETFCVPRIRGAILDELRSMDWVPRLVRSRAHKLDVAVRAMEMELGRKPTEQELAKHLNTSLTELRKLARDAQAVSMISLNRKWFETDSHKDVREIDMLEDKRIENPLLKAQAKDIKSLITRGLNRAERLIIVLYYYEQMTMKEIGETLDLSESRVSQMHSAILERLKSQLNDRQKELHVG
ncbi:MAG: FliA/WhiG family RNA polymerase sigma factor [Planctomycetes bacterium]|nr:FliA/WhiG family RNA polymerase sigma factor [Planctomycetota bacterium]